MGQPFLLTPNYDPSRQNPLFGSPSSSFTPPTTLPAISPSLKDLEQLKHQYEKVQQQLLQQQLFLSQTFQQQAKDSAAVGSTSQVRGQFTSCLSVVLSLGALERGGGVMGKKLLLFKTITPIPTVSMGPQKLE